MESPNRLEKRKRNYDETVIKRIELSRHLDKRARGDRMQHSLRDDTLLRLLGKRMVLGRLLNVSGAALVRRRFAGGL